MTRSDTFRAPMPGSSFSKRPWRSPQGWLVADRLELRAVQRSREVLLLVEHAGELVGVGQRIGSVLKADRKVSAADRYDEL